MRPSQLDPRWSAPLEHSDLGRADDQWVSVGVQEAVSAALEDVDDRVRRLRGLLGVASINFKPGQQRLAILSNDRRTLRELLRGELVTPDQIIASHPREDRREALAAAHGIRTVGSNADAVRGARGARRQMSTTTT